MTRAMLLCAGLGTRLGKLSAEVPKPLLPISDIPIIRFGIANLVASGITDLVVNTHHLPEAIETVLGDGHKFGAHIQYSHEPEILGTGGGLKKALPLLDPDGTDQPFISLNGKLIFDLDIPQLLRAFAAADDAIGMMVVRRVVDAENWGAVDVRDGSVRNILGRGHHMFCGVHVTRPSVIARLPPGESCSIRQGYLPWIQQGERVAAYVHEDGYFSEHSTAERYFTSCMSLLAGAKLRHPPGPLQGIATSAQLGDGVVITQPVFIGDGALLGAGAHIGPRATIGAGAIVAANSTVRDAVVWARSTVSGQVENAIITPATTLSPVA